MLNTCNTSHTTCKAGVLQQILGGSETPRFIPKRLLHIGSDSWSFQVRLHETTIEVATSSEVDLRYTALSHCWGSTPIIKTTTDTMSGFKTEGISWAWLPKTFQEAILLTRELGFNYIWIDSLCKYLRNTGHTVNCTKSSYCDRHFARLSGRLGSRSFSNGQNIFKCGPHDCCICS